MDGLSVPIRGFRILTGTANRPLAEGIALAAASIDEGKAAAVLERLRAEQRAAGAAKETKS